MKTIFLGDTHGRSLWKDIVQKEAPDRVVFIGDYFDSFDIGSAEQQFNFKEIIKFKENNECEVIMLVGNHDYHYYPGGETYSGYQHGAAPAIRQLLEDNKHHLQMCYQLDNILCSHAGIGHNWLVEQEKYESGSIADFVNSIWNYKPNRFIFYGLDPYGDSKTQTPIWIRPKALMNVNYNTLRTQVIQIVGHTQVKKLDLDGSQKSAGGRYYLIDCQDSTGEYLVIQDGELSVGTTR